MKELRVLTPNLSAVTMDTIVAEAVGLVGMPRPKQHREDVRLILTEARFIDPYGLVSLWTIVRYLKLHFRRVRIVFPDDEEVQSYLQRMRFPTALSGVASIENQTDGRKHIDKPSDVLLELTTLEKKGDLVEITREILGRIGKILQNTLGYKTRDINSFSDDDECEDC